MNNAPVLVDLNADFRIVAEAWIATLAGQGISLELLTGYVTKEQQDALYVIGRTAGDDRDPVTFDKGGEAWANTGRAVTVAPRIGQVLVEDPFPNEASRHDFEAGVGDTTMLPIWQSIVAAAESSSMTWSGRAVRRNYLEFYFPGDFGSPGDAWALERPEIYIKKA